MSFKVALETHKIMGFACSWDAAWSLFSDIERTALLFPGIKGLESLGHGQWKWTLEEYKVQRYRIQVAYACQYVFEPRAGLIKWIPVKGQGNAACSGHIQLEAKGGGQTVARFDAAFELTIPLSSLAKGIVKPFVQRQFSANLETLEQNAKTALEGKQP